MNNSLEELPKISIITCIYNGATYISKLFDSVLNMGYPNIEHIVVNDGSTDHTEGIILEYMNKYSEKNLSFVYITQENQGLGAATNTGLKYVTGKYWTWINCDDWYEPNAFLDPIRVLESKKNISYIQLNGYYVKNGKKSIIVEKQNKLAFTNRKRLYKQFCFKDKDRVWLLYLCRTEDYRRICPSMEIYPSRFTQDEQLIYQMFGLLNGTLYKKPVWNFFIRNDSYFAQHSDDLLKEYDTLKVNSIKLLNVDKKIKRALIALIFEMRYINMIKGLALNHKTKQLFDYIKKNKSIRANIGFSFFLYFNHISFLYILYSIFGLRNRKLFHN